MNLQRLRIQNYKSLVDVELVNPNPFTVFVGPNAAGKSNIFEALEFWNLTLKFSLNAVRFMFDGKDIVNAGSEHPYLHFETVFPDSGKLSWSLDLVNGTGAGDFAGVRPHQPDEVKKHPGLYQFIYGFHRVFAGKEELERINFVGDEFLTISARNLPKVLKRILKDEDEKEELFEWMQLFVPEFDNLEIHSDGPDGADYFSIHEKYSKKPFSKALVSDGTQNILALLTAVYQSNEPQFLCIEEPENGLHPKVVKELVNFFRAQCEEKGHYIWLNTHSQTLVSQLEPKEIVVVNKIEGETRVRQFIGKNLFGLKMDEAWLGNALGGGLPW